MIAGSGLRAGDLSDGAAPNSLHTTPYAVINVGVAQIKWSTDAKPLTVRFDIVNLFDQIYELRDGTGIGVFAPQYGARRDSSQAFRKSCDDGPPAQLIVRLLLPESSEKAGISISKCSPLALTMP